MMGNLPPTNLNPAQLAEMQKQRRIANALNGQDDFVMPKTAGQGLMAIGDALVDRRQAMDATFPQMPGGGKPDWLTNFGNLFSFGNKGGLY